MRGRNQERVGPNAWSLLLNFAFFLNLALTSSLSVVDMCMWKIHRIELKPNVGYSHCGTEYGGSPQLKIGLPYDPAIPSLGVSLKKTRTQIQKDSYAPVFIVVLFTIARV